MIRLLIAGVPVWLGTEMAKQPGVPVAFVAYSNSGQIVDAADTGVYDVTFLPVDAERTFKQTTTAVAVPLRKPLSLTFVTGFMNEAKTNGLLRAAYDANGLKDMPIRVK